MGSESPNAILYDYQGNELAVQNGAAIPANTPLLLVGGSDGTNSRYLLIDSSGRQIVAGAGTAGTPAGGVLSIQGVASGTNVPVSQGTSPWTDNITQFGGTNLSTGTGASGAGIPRVTVANDSNILATQSGTWTVAQGTAAALAGAWPQKITDGTNGPAAVKASATSPIATDSALVVVESPNSPLLADTLASGTLNALNAAVTIVLSAKLTTGFQLAAGTLVGTIVAELSFDGGTTWNTTYIDQLGGNKVSSIVFASSNTATAGTIVGAGGAGAARIRVSAFTSGTANITVRATQLHDPSSLFGGAPGATVQPPDGVQIAGWDSAGVLRVPSVKAASTSATVSDQALVVTISPNQTAIPVSNSPSTASPATATGYVITSATTKTAVIASTYVEQTTNAQRSFKSSSASDAAAGVGARTIIVTYYDQTMAGPSTETITLNGTTAVNSVSTTMCYIESIQVATAGTSLSNVGIISMFTTTGGGGSTMATVNAGENKTFWANHYVATGKTCYITGLSGHNTNTSNGSVLTITSFNPTSANSAENQISDFVRVGGGTAQPVREYNNLIKVSGPARIRLYEACEGTANITTRAAFDYYDQ